MAVIPFETNYSRRRDCINCESDSLLQANLHLVRIICGRLAAFERPGELPKNVMVETTPKPDGGTGLSASRWGDPELPGCIQRRGAGRRQRAPGRHAVTAGLRKSRSKCPVVSAIRHRIAPCRCAA